MIYDGNGKKAIAIAGSGSNTGLIPYDVSYNNADNIFSDSWRDYVSWCGLLF